MILIFLINILFYLNLMTRICDSSLVSTNHKLGSGLSRVSLDRLCKKITESKTPNTCKIVSCIGANGWKQRLLLEKSFGLDPSKSSTLSGPLRPRSDLWELKAPGGPSLLLDSEMPNFENEVRSNVDNSSFIKLSALSSCIYVFLNESDFDVNDGEVKFGSNVKRFFEKLSKRIQFEAGGRDKKIKNMFIVFPDFKSFEKKVKMTKLNRGKLEKELTVYFPKNLYIKQFNDKLDFSKDLKATSTLTVQEVAQVLRSFSSNRQLALALDYLSTKSFQNMSKFVDESLEKALKNEKVEEFAKTYQAQVLDSRISYYTLAMQLLGKNVPVNLFEVSNSYSAKLCIESLVKNVEKEMRLEFAKYYLENSKTLDIKLAVDQFIHKYKSRMESIFPYQAQSEFGAVVENTAHRLENYMYHVDEIYRKFPNKSDGVTDRRYKNVQGEKSDKALTEIKKKLKGSKVGVFVRLLGVMRGEGDGKTKVVFNKMFLNQYLPFSLPVVLTLGYSNDRNLVDDGSGTGVMAPRFKIQPIIHLNVPL